MTPAIRPSKLGYCTVRITRRMRGAIESSLLPRTIHQRWEVQVTDASRDDTIEVRCELVIATGAVVVKQL